MDPKLLAQLTQVLQQVAQSGGAANQAVSQFASTLASQTGASSAALNQLASSASGASSNLSAMTNSMGAVPNLLFRFAQGLVQGAVSHAKLSMSMFKLNRTVYETENVFQNMSSQLEVGQKAVMDAIEVISTWSKALPGFLGMFSSAVITEGGKLALSVANEFFQQMVMVTGRIFESAKKTNTQFGLLTSNLDDFSTKAAEASLTSEQFGRILSSNAASLNEAFGNVAMGADFVRDAFNHMLVRDLDKNMFRRFRGLGMEIDDVAEALIDYRALQTQTGQSAAKTMEEQIDNTLNYIGQLKVLQAITGDDVKAQKQRQRELLQQAAFRAKYQRMMAAGQVNQAQNLMYVNTVLSKFGPTAQKAMMEVSAYGDILTSESAQYAQQFPAVVSLIRDLVTRANTVDISPKEFEKVAAAQMGASYGAIKANQAQIDASGLLVAGLTTNSSTFLQNLSENSVKIADFVERFKNVSITVSEIQENLDKTKDLGRVGELEARNFLQQQKQRSELEGMLLDKQSQLLEKTGDYLETLSKAQFEITKIYSKYAVDVASTMAGFSEAVLSAHKGTPGALQGIFDRLEKMLPGSRAPTYRDVEDLKKQIEQKKSDLDALRGQTTATTANTQKIETLTEEITALYRALARESVSEGAAMPKPWAQGGVASGPKTGYQAILHGIEAVVPLPDNRSIPVTLNTTGLEATIQSLADRIGNQPAAGVASADLARYLETNNALSRELLKELRKGNEISDKIRRATA